MNIDMEVTANLTSADVNDIVKDYLENQGYTVSEIKPIVGTRMVGQQMYEETYFSGIEAKIKVKPINSDDAE